MFEYTKMTISGIDVYHYPVCDSTNKRIKEMAHDAKNGTVCIADQQTEGRGRKDRKWLSRSGAGAWFSCLIKPDKDIPAMAGAGLVFVSAISTASVLREMTGADIRIKWPNDLVLNGKKICGIMCEMRLRDMFLDYAVAGIGVNLIGHDFPEDLPYASSIEHETGIRITPIEFLGKFIETNNKYLKIWEESGVGEILRRIEPISATIGKTVKAISDSGTIVGKAIGFTEDGSLRIMTDTGERTFIAGDVSVRGIMGYSD